VKVTVRLLIKKFRAFTGHYFHHRAHRSPSLFPILSHMTEVYALPSYI